MEGSKLVVEEGHEKSLGGEPSVAQRASKAGRGAAIKMYAAQDRPELVATARALFPHAQKVKRLSTKQLWVQEAIQSCSVEVQETPRAENAFGILPHLVGESKLRLGLRRMGCHTLEECWSIRGPVALAGNLLRQRGSWGGAVWPIGVVGTSVASTKPCSCSGISVHLWRETQDR